MQHSPSGPSSREPNGSGDSSTQPTTSEVDVRPPPAPDADQNTQVGERTPCFLDAFPDDPALEPIVAAFLRGDYAMVRRQAPLLARETTSDAVRDAALELTGRIRPDPLARYLLLLSAALLLLVTIWAYGEHTH